MPLPIHIPRINNNDDTVRVSVVPVAPGAFVRAGDTVLEIESDKAAITVEAEQDGHVLAILAQEGEMVAVGAVALWLGNHAGEAVPNGAASAVSENLRHRPATAKAKVLLQRYGLAEGNIPAAGDRLTAADVEAHVAAHGLSEAVSLPPAPSQSPAPPVPALPAPATIRSAEPARRAMVASVAWQRDHASATYLELPYDSAPWESYAAEFARANRLLFSPLLSLMAYRLVVLAREMPIVNATVVERPDGPVEVVYDTVNLGFTIQGGETLYLAVLAGAEGLDEAGFTARLADLQRRAIARKLEPAELRGATIGFSSMARWGVSRHVPILAPWTAVMVAHAVSGSGASRQAVLGATYDHRVLSGFDAARLLRVLAAPPNPSPS